MDQSRLYFPFFVSDGTRLRLTEPLLALIMQSDFRASYSVFAAGTGSTALFTVICIFASRRVPFCTNKFFNTGLGFSLVILLWAVDRLGR